MHGSSFHTFCWNAVPANSNGTVKLCRSPAKYSSSWDVAVSITGDDPSLKVAFRMRLSLFSVFACRRPASQSHIHSLPPYEPITSIPQGELYRLTVMILFAFVLLSACMCKKLCRHKNNNLNT